MLVPTRQYWKQHQQQTGEIMALTAANVLSEAGAAPVAAERLVVRIIGNLTITRGNDVLGADRLGGPKPRQILEILLLRFGRPVSKETLIGLLWGSRPPAGALSTLESYVSVLRRNLQPRSGKNGALRTTTGGYFIDRDQVDLDLETFDRLLREAGLSEPGRSYGLLKQALELATEPLLGNELLPAWAEDERALHAARVNTAQVLAAEAAAELEKYEEAVAWARLALKRDQINERAWTVLVLGLEAQGQPAEGLQAYERCRRLMLAELGCCPGPALRQAQSRMLKATAGNDDDLNEVLSALLILQGGSARPLREIREAGVVLQDFMYRALAPLRQLQPQG
jgi:SARP family transcriptional regulator, regulator of embCAB operon